MKKVEGYEVSKELENAIVHMACMCLLLVEGYVDITDLCNVTVRGGESDGFVKFSAESRVLAQSVRMEFPLDYANDGVQNALNSYKSVRNIVEKDNIDLYAIKMVCSLKEVRLPGKSIRSKLSCGQVSLYENN